MVGINGDLYFFMQKIFSCFQNKNQNLIYSPPKFLKIRKNYEIKERIKKCSQKTEFRFLEEMEGKRKMIGELNSVTKNNFLFLEVKSIWKN